SGINKISDEFQFSQRQGEITISATSWRSPLAEPQESAISPDPHTRTMVSAESPVGDVSSRYRAVRAQRVALFEGQARVVAYARVTKFSTAKRGVSLMHCTMKQVS